MKKLFAALLLAALFASCATTKPATAPETAEVAEDRPAGGVADASYALGLLMGGNLKSASLEIDDKAFLEGLKAGMGRGEATMSLEEANAVVRRALDAAASKMAEEKLAAEAAFLAENGKRTGVFTTSSGLQYEVLAQGTGPKPTADDTVKVDYVGTLLDGSTFDSSIARGEPAFIPLRQVIAGWSEGLQLMSVGATYKFFIPSALAYGADGAGEVIAPNSTVVFEVTLHSIEVQPKN